MSARVLAIDLGASSGRAVLGCLEDGALRTREIHRFENKPLMKDGSLYWDFPGLVREIGEAIRRAGAFDGVAVDTWGVDYGLLGADGNLVGLPFHYRDARTAGMKERAFARMEAPELYARTGVQMMEINTLFQLLCEKRTGQRLLLMPDLFAYALSGKAACERTIASTTQMLSPATGQWDKAVLARMGIDEGLLAPVEGSARILGPLLERYGAHGNAQVISVAGHDTQSAVAAVALKPGEAFLSCGTWSLLGAELESPVLTDESMEAGFSNELGANGKVNYLTNIVGLWILQELRREANASGAAYSFAQLMDMAREQEPFVCLIDPDDARFSAPGDMLCRMQQYCRDTAQPAPQTLAQAVRCVYESLALKYDQGMRSLARLTGRRMEALHIVGGGANASLLCQLTADALGLPVYAGPAEATALGNIMLQLIALGEIRDMEQGRAIIAQTEKPVVYRPQACDGWEAARARFAALGRRT